MMLLPVILLVACPWVDEADRAAAADRDGDGVPAEGFGGRDCDDADPAVGAPAVAVYPDVDGDGLGDGASATMACAAGPGLVTDATDCDDGNAEVGAAALAWPDADADGFGNAEAEAVLACPAPGFAADGGDCDDADAAWHPGAWESCVGDLDANCDGSVGGDRCSSAGLGPWVYGTEGGVGYGAGFGERLLGGIDIDGDGILDVVAGARYAFETLAFSGADLLGGPDLEDTDALMEFVEFQAGNGVSFARGDATGDGVPDLLVGCPEEPDGGDLLGANVAVVALPTDGQVRASDARLAGDDPSGWFGYSMAYNPDNDGVATLLVGAPRSNEFTGAAWAVELPLPGEGDHLAADLPHAVLGGMPSGGDGFGVGWEVGWLERAGGDVAVVANPAARVGREVAGAVVLWQPALGAEPASIAVGEGTGVVGIGSYEGFGYSVAVGDYDGDGKEDLAVGSIHGDRDGEDVGAVYLYLSAAELEGWQDETAADVTFRGEAGPDVSGADWPLLGARVVFSGDMNGDGQGDLAMSAPFVTGLGGEVRAGAVYVVPGGLAGREHDVEAVAWARYGASAGLGFGAGLTPAGDVDDDGRADLVVGAYGWPSGGEAPLGALTLWFGGQL